MSNELQVLTKRNFNGVCLDCYGQNGQDAGDFWATREQIGELLGYNNPVNAVGRIHQRNKERLDKFSTVRQIDTPSRGIQTATVYNFKGLLEICRYSNQPKANAVMDWLWDIADELRRTGIVALNSQVMQLTGQVKALEAGNIQLKQENAELQAQVSEMYPLKVLGEIVLAQKGSVSIQEAAQLLSAHGFPIGQNRLYRLLRKLGIICRRKGRQWNNPTQKSVERGWLNLQIDHGFYVTPRVTPKGLQLFVNILTSQEFPLIDLIESLEK